MVELLSLNVGIGIGLRLFVVCGLEIFHQLVGIWKTPDIFLKKGLEMVIPKVVPFFRAVIDFSEGYVTTNS